MDVLVDFETAGLYENAILLSMGITCFELEDVPDIEKLKRSSTFIKFNQEEQRKSGKFSVDKSVLEWWKKQDKAVIDAAFKPTENDVSIRDACYLIRKFITLHGYDYKLSNLWARGTDFDIPKLRYLFRVANESYPFNPFKCRDVRTYVDILGGTDTGNVQVKGNVFDGLAKHNPMNDTIRDAYVMQMLYQEAIGE